jgi:hypothetical protein
VLYLAVMAIGVGGGQPVLGSLGYAAALLLPVAAWITGICVAGEPGPARACVASAVGAARAHRGVLLTALGASLLLGAAGALAVASIGGRYSDDHRTAVAFGPALAAGVTAAAVSALLGTAVGALAHPPGLRRRPGWSVLASLLGSGAMLLVPGSPARTAVSALVTGSGSGRVHCPFLALALAALVTVAVGVLTAQRAHPART